MPHQNTIIKIHGIAFYFAHFSQDLNEIAEATGVGERQIRRYAETLEWDNALTAWGYTGNRNFTIKPSRDTVRDNGETFLEARKVYLEALRNRQPKHKLATIAGDAVGLPRRRIHAWAKQYGWREMIHNNEQNGGIKA